MYAMDKPTPFNRLESIFTSDDSQGYINNDTLTVTLSFENLDAQWIMTEASARGVSYSDMVKILCQQGMIFWQRKY